MAFPDDALAALHLDHQNVGPTERLVSAAAGAALVGLGLSRRSGGGALLAAVGSGLLLRGTTGHCPVYEATSTSRAKAPGVLLEESLTVARPRAEAYELWRHFDRFDRFMTHIERVVMTGDKRSRWTAKGPGGIGEISWDAETTAMDENTRVAWRSLEGADVDNEGEVRFKDAPAGRGTEVHVRIRYAPPAGALGTAAAKLFNPAFEKIIRDDLRRFRMLLETGEVATTEGQPKGA